MNIVTKKMIQTKSTLAVVSHRWITVGMVSVGWLSLIWLYINGISMTNASSYIFAKTTTAPPAPQPPPTLLDPHIRLVQLQAFHPCDEHRTGEIMPLHVSCLTTILVESDDAMQAFEHAIPSNPRLLPLLCKKFQSIKNNEEAVLLTCLQTPDSLGALVREQNNEQEGYSPVFPSEASSIVAAVWNEVDEHHQADHSVRIVERKTAVMHSYYPPRSPEHDMHRNSCYPPGSPVHDMNPSISGNSGNLLWQFAATRMFNPATTLLVWDVEYNMMLVKAKKTLISEKAVKVFATPMPTVSAFIIATANVLPLEKPGARVSHLFQDIYERIDLFQVPVIVMGMGMQASFEFIHKQTATITANTKPTVRWQKDATQPTLTGDPDYEAITKSQLQFYDEQVRVLNKIQQMQPPGSKAIGVRGEMTRIVCSNSGIQNCLNTGCPSLTISHHKNLGGELKRKWQVLQQELQDGKKSLNIALTLPSIWISKHHKNNDNSRRYAMLINLLLRITQSSIPQPQEQLQPEQKESSSPLPQHYVVFNTQVQEDALQLKNYVNRYDVPVQSLHGNLIFKQYNSSEEWLKATEEMDLVISPRIHGSMVGFSTAVPTVVIPIDFRIQELVDSMYLTHLTMDDVAKLPTNTTTSDVNALLLEILQSARYQDFDHFEKNRHDKIRQWYDMISEAGLEMDPALVRILKSSTS